MSRVKRLLLDVLKPHSPNPLAFATALAEQGTGYRVTVTVTEVDEKTESVVVLIEGDDIIFDSIAAAINALGASLHSIDGVEMINTENNR